MGANVAPQIDCGNRVRSVKLEQATGTVIRPIDAHPFQLWHRQGGDDR